MFVFFLYTENIDNEISTEVNKTKSNELLKKQNFDTNANVSKTKMFMDKKKRERAAKNKLESLKKKYFIEERKKKLEQLRHTTKELIMASVKQKVFKLLLLID